MNNEEYFNRSLLRALSIIELFAKENRPMGVGEITRLNGLSKSTTHRLILTLESRGWLRRLTNSDKYRLGIKVAAMATSALDNVGSKNEIHPFIQKLSDTVNETVILSVWDGNEVVCIDKIEGSQMISVTSEVGQFFPIHAGASGFSVLTTMPEEMAMSIIKSENLVSYTPNTITSISKLIKRYIEAKESGYVISRGERDMGVSSIACGLYFPYEQLHAGLAVVLPDSRATEQNLEKIIDSLLDTSRNISQHLNFSPK